MVEPKVRFKQDNGCSYPAWKTVPFSKLSYPSGIKNKNDVNLESYSISSEKGFIPQNEQFDDAGYLTNADRTLYYIVSPGSFAYNPARINIGSIGYQNVNKDVLVSSLYEVFNTTEELDDMFLMNWFRTNQFQKNVRRLSEGGVRQYFYYDKLCMVKFPLPCIEEQQKIATFLSFIDKVIDISEQEIIKLKELKKGMLQKLFPLEGKSIPEIRFPGFINPWKQCKISDLFDSVESGNRLPKTMLTTGNIPYVVASSENNGIVAYVNEEQKDYNGNRMKLFPGNSITFSIDNPDAIFVQNKAFFTSNVMRVLHNDNYSYNQVIVISEMIKRLTTYYNWTFKFSGPVVMNSNIYLPISKSGEIDFEEIEAIGIILSKFDDLVTLCQCELDKWRKLKKSLLQQMFV